MLTIEKIAVLAPTSNASVRSETTVNTGVRRSVRSACRMSRARSSSHGRPR